MHSNHIHPIEEANILTVFGLQGAIIKILAFVSMFLWKYRAVDKGCSAPPVDISSAKQYFCYF